MKTNAYTVLGWLVWQLVRRIARRKLAAQRGKLIAAAVIGAVLIAGIAAARSESGDE
jgi:hypothetical protein